MTTNIAQSFNKILKGVQSLPLCAIIELTFYRTVEYFRDYDNQAQGCTTRFAPRVHMVLDARRANAQHHRTRIFDRRNNEFEVLCHHKYASGYSTGDTVQQCTVGPTEAKCTCNKPKVEHIPCSHVLAACRELGGNDGGQYVSWFYTTEALRNTWHPKMHSYSVGSSHKMIEGPNWAPVAEPSILHWLKSDFPSLEVIRQLSLFKQYKAGSPSSIPEDLDKPLC